MLCATTGPLKEFLVTATGLPLAVDHVDVTRVDLHGPMLHKFGMTEKKYHEVTEMSRHVASMAECHGIKQVWYKTKCLLLLSCLNCQLSLFGHSHLKYQKFLK